MPKAKTHTAIVVRNDGKKRVKIHMTATTWAVSSKEFYYRDTGQRCGVHGRARLLLDTMNVAPLQGERHGFAVPMLCTDGAPFYTQPHVYSAPGKAAFHHR